MMNVLKWLWLVWGVVCVKPLFGIEGQPSWWAERGVVDSSEVPSNFSPINQGQLKMFALAAYEELEEYAPGGAGEPLKEGLFGTPGERDGLLEKNTTPYAGVTQGQLKNLAAQFLLRLGQIGYFKMNGDLPAYPWPTVASPDPRHKALANMGMAKHLFNWDLRKDAEAVPDGLPDWWEVYQFGQGKRYSEWTHSEPW